MKRIIAFIKPNMLADVVCALHKVENLSGATISEVKGIGRVWCMRRLAESRLAEIERVTREFLEEQGAMEAVDRPRLMPGADIEPKPALEQISGGDEEFAPVRDLAAEIVRQATIRERDILVLFQQNDFRILVHAAGAGGGGSAAGDSTDDHNSQRRLGHGSIPLSRY